MNEPLTDAQISPERLDKLIEWFSFGYRPSVGGDTLIALRELKALRERVAMLDARDPPNIYTEYMGLIALSPKLIKDGFDWRDDKINKLKAAAGQASFCLREKLPNDVDARLSVRMLTDAMAACSPSSQLPGHSKA